MIILKTKIVFTVQKIMSDGSMSQALRFDTLEQANKFVDGRLSRDANVNWLVSKVEIVRDTAEA